jgi:hypothetical protein
MTKIYGNGQMYVPTTGKFIPFSEGVILTTDESVIKAGQANGFRIESDQPELDLAEPEQPKPRGRRNASN